MILSAQTIRKLCQGDKPMIWPFDERAKIFGRSYGLSSAGYDICVAETVDCWTGQTSLTYANVRFEMPDNVLGVVHDKSTNARLGLSVQNTIIEPGWLGFLTLEILYMPLRGRDMQMLHTLAKGTPIAQVIFHFLDEPTEQPYRGKYQDQAEGAQKASLE